MNVTAVEIIPSLELERMRLGTLAGRSATIIEPIFHQQTGKIRGCWVKLDGSPYLDESEWYIPYESLIFIRKVGNIIYGLCDYEYN